MDRLSVFLNPDGTQAHAVYALVLHPTGVWYGTQCAGYLTEQRSAEGFLIPLGGKATAEPLMTWFRKTFRGNSHSPASTWPPQAIDELRTLIATLTCWHTDPVTDADRSHPLRLDESRLAEGTEAWIPTAPCDKGILLFPNCD